MAIFEYMVESLIHQTGMFPAAEPVVHRVLDDFSGRIRQELLNRVGASEDFMRFEWRGCGLSEDEANRAWKALVEWGVEANDTPSWD